jgi:hypothetical protein
LIACSPLKNFPETEAYRDFAARDTRLAAAPSGGLEKMPVKRRIGAGASFIRPDLTKPGWKAFEVEPLPWRRRDNS